MRRELLRARAAMMAIDAADEAISAERLYATWYHAPDGSTFEYPTEVAYRASTLDPARFENGWRVGELARVVPAAVIAEQMADRSGEVLEVRWLAPYDYILIDTTRLTIEPGIAVRVDPLVSSTADGYWHLWSPCWRREGPPTPLQRVYLTVTPGRERDFAACLVKIASLEERWYAKFLTGTHPRGRCDPAVLYLAVDRDLTSGWPVALFEDTARLREDRLPPLTRPLHLGVGQALDPDDRTSFGQAVCARLCAEYKRFTTDSPTPDDDEAWLEAAWRALTGLVGTPSE